MGGSLAARWLSVLSCGSVSIPPESCMYDSLGEREREKGGRINVSMTRAHAPSG